MLVLTLISAFPPCNIVLVYLIALLLVGKWDSVSDLCKKIVHGKKEGKEASWKGWKVYISNSVSAAVDFALFFFISWAYIPVYFFFSSALFLSFTWTWKSMLVTVVFQIILMQLAWSLELTFLITKWHPCTLKYTFIISHNVTCANTHFRVWFDYYALNYVVAKNKFAWLDEIIYLIPNHLINTVKSSDNIHYL